MNQFLLRATLVAVGSALLGVLVAYPFVRVVLRDQTAAEPRRAAVHRSTVRIGREWKVLIISSVAVFMAFLDVTIANIAFSSIHHSFARTSMSTLSWVLNGYNVALAALLVPAGRLADRVGRRRIFFVGVGLFLTGSGLCGFAPTASVLIAARIGQGTGAALMIPASLGLVLAECPPGRRAMSTGVWAAAGAIAAATGASLGGVLVQSTSWRWAFYVNFVIALALLAAPRLLAESREGHAGASSDLLGSALLAGGVGALALGIVKAPDWGWTSQRVLTAWLVSAALVAALVLRSRTRPAPVVEPTLLRIRTFGVAISSFLLFSMGMFALLLGNIVS